jgi:hypothetical protein
MGCQSDPVHRFVAPWHTPSHHVSTAVWPEEVRSRTQPGDGAPFYPYYGVHRLCTHHRDGSDCVSEINRHPGDWTSMRCDGLGLWQSIATSPDQVNVKDLRFRGHGFPYSWCIACGQRVFGAAGPGFEPGLTDPELISLGSPLFAGTSKSAYLRLILKSHVSRRSPVFAPVTVKSLSKLPLSACLLRSIKRSTGSAVRAQGNRPGWGHAPSSVEGVF